MQNIRIKTEDEIRRIRAACRIVAETLNEIEPRIRAGVSTGDLDSCAEKSIREKGGDPVFIGYRGFRHATCISINEEIVHGIPGERRLQDGDLVSVDVGARVDGYCGDSARTFMVGKASGKARRLVKVCREALKAGIKLARAGNHLGDISCAIQKVAERAGYAVVRELYGHGIGKDLHEDPIIPNFGEPGEGPGLKPGMVLAIEPMLNIGTWKIRTLEDKWTVVTADRSLSCHFEHTVLITGGDPEILTL